jgi:hypothetical protein
MRLLVAAAFAVLSLNAHADPAKLDHASENALQQTQAMLGNQKAMQDYAKTNPDAAKAMNQVSTLTGGNEADSAAVYKLASDIFSNMTKESGGDAGGMEKILAEAMKNPQAFASKLTPEQRQQLQSLTKSIESRAPSTAPH